MPPRTLVNAAPLMVVLLTMLMLWTGGCQADCSTAGSSCTACVNELPGCGFCPTSGQCVALSGGSCDALPLRFQTECPGSSSGAGGSGSTAAGCTATYQGPTGDPQVSTQCQAAWNYRCKDNDSTKADQQCRVYDSLSATVSCPYCSGSTSGTGGGRGSTTSMTGACGRVIPLQNPSCSVVMGPDYCPSRSNGGYFFLGKTCADIRCTRDGGCVLR